MSGTSMDAVDAAVVEVRSSARRPVATVRELATFARAYPARLRERLMGAAEAGPMTAGQLASLSVELGELFARTATAAIRKAKLDVADIDAIASHGQTIAHLPARRTTTVQIGEPSIIAERVGVTVVSDFRVADTAAGGQGAPLVPWVHDVMFARRGRRVAVVNIGGMANVTILEPGRSAHPIKGGDSGPGNALIDGAVERLSGGGRRMDRGGRMAAGHNPDPRLVATVLDSPFFRTRGRRSTGREDFGRGMVERVLGQAKRRRLADGVVVASLAMASARSIARTCLRFSEGPVDEVLVCGGGALNQTLMAMLAAELGGVSVATTDIRGFDPFFVEAGAFAVLGHLALRGVAGNVGSITGAAGPRVLGKISPGANYRSTRLRSSR